MLPPFNGRSWSHMKQNCWGGGGEGGGQFWKAHSSEACFAFCLCPVLCPLTPPHLPTTTAWNLPRLPPPSPLRKGRPLPRLAWSNECAACSQLPAALPPLPSQVGLGQRRELTWGCLLYPVAFRIAILLLNFNKTVQGSFADKKTRNQSYKLAPLRKWV